MSLFPTAKKETDNETDFNDGLGAGQIALGKLQQTKTQSNQRIY